MIGVPDQAQGTPRRVGSLELQSWPSMARAQITISDRVDAGVLDELERLIAETTNRGYKVTVDLTPDLMDALRRPQH